MLVAAQEAAYAIRKKANNDADLTDSALARRVQRELKAIGGAYAQLVRRYPDSIQRQQCAAILRQLGIEPPE